MAKTQHKTKQFLTGLSRSHFFSFNLSHPHCEQAAFYFGGITESAPFRDQGQSIRAKQVTEKNDSSAVYS